MKYYAPSTGAIESKKDSRTISHELSFASLLDRGGVDYFPDEIEHQHKVGICTAISLTQNAHKAIGRKFSADFQYLLQKKYYDLNWEEGSSILSALKVGKRFGFLPVEEFPYVSESDRELTYSEYIAKLQAIPQSEIDRLVALCADFKLSGYASVGTDSQSLAKGINDSKSGILCRFEIGEEWWTAVNGVVTWLPKYINPLRKPKTTSSGHAITGARFDYTQNIDVELVNTWGTDWCRGGKADVLVNDYAPTEAWIPYFGLTDEENELLKKQLQAKLTILQKLIELYKKLRN